MSTWTWLSVGTAEVTFVALDAHDSGYAGECYEFHIGGLDGEVE